MRTKEGGMKLNKGINWIKTQFAKEVVRDNLIATALFIAAILSLCIILIIVNFFPVMILIFIFIVAGVALQQLILMMYQDWRDS